MDEELKKELERIAEEAKKEMAAIRKEMEKAMAGNASAETVKQLDEAHKETMKKLDEALEAMKEQGMQINAMKESGSIKGDIKEVATKALDEALKAQANELSALANGSGGLVKLALKAASTITSDNFGAGVLQGLRMAGIEAFDRNPNFIMNEITVINGGPGSDPFSVVERVNADGGAAPVAEGDEKPFYDFEYAEKKVVAQTIAAIVPVSKQALLRMPMLRSHIMEELMAELEEKLQYYIIKGTGVAPQIDGIKNNAVAFDAGGLAGEVSAANEFDVVRAISAQVYRNRGKAGVVMVHPDKIALMDLKKTTDGVYIIPPFATADGTVVSGARVRECFEMGTDEFLGGDLKKYLFNIVEDITFDVGYINDQFRRNQLSTRAEIMGAGLVKNQHKNKLIKGDFTTAKAALLAAS